MEIARSRYVEIMEQFEDVFEGHASVLRDLARRQVIFNMWNNGEIDDRALLWVVEEGRLSNEICAEIFGAVEVAA
jgi:hypothetical protein